MTTREPEWTEQDQAEILALAEYRDSLCDCCGMPKAMTLVHEKDAPQFRVSKRMCHARRTLNESQAGYFGGKEPTPSQLALRWSVSVEKG